LKLGSSIESFGDDRLYYGSVIPEVVIGNPAFKALKLGSSIESFGDDRLYYGSVIPEGLVGNPAYKALKLWFPDRITRG